MKKIFPLIACVCLLIASLAVPSMAAENAIPWVELVDLKSPDYIDLNGISMQNGDYSGRLYVGFTSEAGLQPGTYYVLGNSPVGEFPSECASVLLLLVSDGGVYSEAYGFGETFEVPQGYTAGVIAQSQYSHPVLYSGDNSGTVAPSGDGLYYDAFDLFRAFIFGVSELNAYEQAICSGLAAASVIMLAIAPFVLVYWIIRMIGRW